MSITDAACNRRRTVRKNTTLACDICQKKKIRCVPSAASSGCKACTKDGRQCTYDNPTRRTFQKSFLISTRQEKAPAEKIASQSVPSQAVQAALRPWQDKLSPAEMQGLVHFLTVADGPCKSFPDMLPNLLEHLDLHEFRFLVHTICSAASFLIVQPKALPRSEGVSHYISAVDLLPGQAQDPLSAHLLPVIALLDLIQEKIRVELRPAVGS